MKAALKVVGVFVLFFVVLFAIGAGFGVVNLGWVKTFGVANENARREVYEGTKSYHQGSVQRLGTLCKQVADAEDKRLLNGVIEQEFQEWNLQDVPQHLRPCLSAARAK